MGSKQKAVATRFAGDEGMLIVLDNQRGYSKLHERFWDCSWLSAFNEEDERLWFGGWYKVDVCSVILIESALNYKRSMAAFWKFDAILSGQRVNQVEVSSRDVEIVRSSMASVLDEAFAANANLDAYALDN